MSLAVICRPKLIIADEPTAALDVTAQAQILKLLKDINIQYKTSILFISHDLGVISKLCNRVAVMYAGSFVEEGSTENIFYKPIHQYTRGLIESIPTRKNKGKRLVSIPGKVPSIKENVDAALHLDVKRQNKNVFIRNLKVLHLSPLIGYAAIWQ